MHVCSCGKECKSAAGLSAHRRLKHPEQMFEGGPNRRALEQTLAQIAAKPGATVDPASMQVARSLADAVDETSDNAQLWRTYREAIADLREVLNDAGDESDDDLAAIRGTAKVGHLQAVR